MLFYVLFVLFHSLYCLCVYMCTVLMPPGGYPIAVNKYIISLPFWPIRGPSPVPAAVTFICPEFNHKVSVYVRLTVALVTYLTASAVCWLCQYLLSGTEPPLVPHHRRVKSSVVWRRIDRQVLVDISKMLAYLLHRAESFLRS